MKYVDTDPSKNPAKKSKNKENIMRFISVNKSLLAFALLSDNNTQNERPIPTKTIGTTKSDFNKIVSFTLPPQKLMKYLAYFILAFEF